ncbi:hypothetical protein PFISCL1PPCAC_21522, partial [Pristionchus fissidentatus]
MDSIATLGEHITLNSIYAGEAPQQFTTFPTKLVHKTREAVRNESDLYCYTLFRKAVSLWKRKGKTDENGLSSIGVAVAPLVIIPEIYALTTDDQPCSGEITDAAAAAAISTCFKPLQISREVQPSNERKGFVESLPASLKGWKPIRSFQSKQWKGTNENSNEPGPSSPK